MSVVLYCESDSVVFIIEKNIEPYMKEATMNSVIIRRTISRSYFAKKLSKHKTICAETNKTNLDVTNWKTVKTLC